MTVWVKWLLKVAPVVVAFVVVLGSSRPALAQFRCFETLRDCYGQAAMRQSVWDMWLAGLDCELNFADCTRRALIGR